MTLDKKTRVEMALRHQEPDRVPRCELVIDEQLVKEFAGKKDFDLEEVDLADWMEFLEHFGLDAVCLSPQNNEFNVHNLKLSSKEPDLKQAVEAYFDYYQPDFSAFEDYRQQGWFIFALLDGSFGFFSRVLGFENFMHALIRFPKELKKAQEQWAQKRRHLALEAVSHGAGAIIWGDDIAYQKGPIISPEMMRDIFFLTWKKEAADIREFGVPVLLHSEGNLNPLLPDLVEIFDGLHSLEPASDMSLHSVKERYGDRLCLMGNIDLKLLYPGEDLEDLRKEVKEALLLAKKGGGYIFGSSGGLCAGLSLENIGAMYSFAEEYGNY